MSDITPPDPTEPKLRPGDEAPAGTPSTGENLCARCSGSGRAPDGTDCPVCVGTGRVTQSIGGA
jgi:DnaJ-class molecular chaperone